MILFIVGNKQLKTLEAIMSKFLDDFRAALEKVAHGNAMDKETKEAVAKLQAQLDSNDATDAEQSTAITELVNKLAESTPPAETPPAA